MSETCPIGVKILLISPEREANLRGVAMSASRLGASEILVLNNKHFSDDLLKALANVYGITIRPVSKIPNCPIVPVEISKDAQPLSTFKHPESAIYVFGPEHGFVPREFGRSVFIPSKGFLNLAAAVGIVLYDRIAKTWVQNDERNCPKSAGSFTTCLRPL